jgi:hypothetical protein
MNELARLIERVRETDEGAVTRNNTPQRDTTAVRQQQQH